jgi:two-component system NtrC family sensor kinase
MPQVSEVHVKDELARAQRELAEAWERQAATDKVLRVISSSPTDVQPVFDAIAESAMRLCDGQFSFVLRFDGDLMHFAASHGLSAEGLEAFRRALPRPVGDDTASGRAILSRDVAHVPDVQADRAYGVPGVAQAVTYRSLVAVPLLREGNPIGAVAVGRARAGPFSERQIKLLQTFADQAVIAIENVRLFDEVQATTRDLTEALEQQTATAEVLQVISRSPGDLQPVFATMLKNAVRICDAKFGAVYRCEGDVFRFVAMHNAPPALAELGKYSPFRPSPRHYFGPLLATKSVVQIADIATEQGYIDQRPEYVSAVERGGVRTYVAVPMLRENELIGVFLMGRQEVRLFTDKQIALVQNFAAQAVIAIENTRLLNELRESLQRQTATAEVLKVISRSTFDLQMVLDALVHSVARLCEAHNSFLFRHESGKYIWSASYGFSGEYLEYMRNRQLTPERGTATGRAALEGKIVHIPDVLEDSEYTWWEAQKVGHFRAGACRAADARGTSDWRFGIDSFEPEAIHRQTD